MSTTASLAVSKNLSRGEYFLSWRKTLFITVIVVLVGWIIGRELWLYFKTHREYDDKIKELENQLQNQLQNQPQNQLQERNDMKNDELPLKGIEKSGETCIDLMKYCNKNGNEHGGYENCETLNYAEYCTEGENKESHDKCFSENEEGIPYWEAQGYENQKLCQRDVKEL